MRSAAILLALSLWAGDARAAVACPAGLAPVERPWVVGAAAGAGFGFFYATHGRLTLDAGRRFRGRLELDLRLALASAPSLFGLEPALRLGVVFPLSRSAHFALSGWGGYAAHRLVEPTRARWLGTAVLGAATEVRLPLGARWELWLVPASIQGYLQSPLWGVILEPSAGLRHRF